KKATRTNANKGKRSKEPNKDREADDTVLRQHIEQVVVGRTRILWVVRHVVDGVAGRPHPKQGMIGDMGQAHLPDIEARQATFLCISDKDTLIEWPGIPRDIDQYKHQSEQCK